MGYTVRFASTHIPGKNKIRYVTDGWLLRECVLLDPLLRHCSVLLIDEAHERSVNTELLLATVKKICKVRPELRVIICSATLDTVLPRLLLCGEEEHEEEEHGGKEEDKGTEGGRENKGCIRCTTTSTRERKNITVG